MILWDPLVVRLSLPVSSTLSCQMGNQVASSTSLYILYPYQFLVLNSELEREALVMIPASPV